MLKRFIRNKRGIGGAAVAVISTVILLFCGIMVMTIFIGSVTPTAAWSLVANNTWTNVQSYAWTAIGLVAIGIIVLGAVAVLMIVGRMGGPSL